MIAVDSQADLTGSAGATNTVSFNNVAGTILFVGLTIASGTDSVTGATYNGVAMTQVTGSPVQTPADLYQYLFYLANPALGTHDVVVSNSGVDFTAGAIVSYSGANGVINTSGNATVNPAASIAKQLTTTVAGCWMIGWCMADAGRTVTAGTDTTLRQDGDGTDRAMFDSNASFAAGNRTINVNLSASDEAALIVAAFEPTPDFSPKIMWFT